MNTIRLLYVDSYNHFKVTNVRTIRTLFITYNLLFKCAAVYHISLNKPRGSSLVVTHRTEDVRVTLDRPVTLGLSPVELSTSIYGSHAVTYVVNTYVYLIFVY